MKAFKLFAHTDALGSPIAKTSTTGALLSRTEYEPYGTTAQGDNPTVVGFTGHVNDPDTGLVHMQQRYYDPLAARFLSEDPVMTDGNTGASFNRYVYGNNNPYRYLDPDGRSSNCQGANGDSPYPCTDVGDGASASKNASAAEKTGVVVGAVVGSLAAFSCDIFTFGACSSANPFIVTGSMVAGGYVGGVTGGQIDRAWTQLSKLLDKATATGPVEYQYALVAEKSGFYPDVRGGIVQLSAKADSGTKCAAFYRRVEYLMRSLES